MPHSGLILYPDTPATIATTPRSAPYPHYPLTTPGKRLKIAPLLGHQQQNAGGKMGKTTGAPSDNHGTMTAPPQKPVPSYRPHLLHPAMRRAIIPHAPQPPRSSPSALPLQLFTLGTSEGQLFTPRTSPSGLQRSTSPHPRDCVGQSCPLQQETANG